MPKKSLLALCLALVLFCQAGFASICQNFLLGGEIGYAARSGEFITRFVAPSIVPVAVYTDVNEGAYDQGTLLGLLVGWQFRHNRWMLGLEGNVDFNNLGRNRPFEFNDKISGTGLFNAAVFYQQGPIYALSLRAGYFVTPFFMPYARLGAQVSSDELNYQVIASTFATTATAPSYDFISNRKSIFGAFAGAGVEFPTYVGATTLRFEYNYIYTQALVMTENGPLIFGTHRYRPVGMQVGKVAFVWNFL